MDADEPTHADADVNSIAERAAELRAALDGLRPEFEVSGPRTVGGIPSANAYKINIPFASPCEVSIVMVTATDLNGVTLTLSTDPNLDIIASGGSSMTTTLDGNQGFLLIVSPQTLGSSPASVTGPVNWFPLQADSALYVRVSGSGNKASYFTLQFRRRINAMGVQSVSARG